MFPWIVCYLFLVILFLEILLYTFWLLLVNLAVYFFVSNLILPYITLALVWKRFSWHVDLAIDVLGGCVVSRCQRTQYQRRQLTRSSMMSWCLIGIQGSTWLLLWQRGWNQSVISWWWKPSTRTMLTWMNTLSQLNFRHLQSSLFFFYSMFSKLLENQISKEIQTLHYNTFVHIMMSTMCTRFHLAHFSWIKRVKD